MQRKSMIRCWEVNGKREVAQIRAEVMRSENERQNNYMTRSLLSPMPATKKWRSYDVVAAQGRVDEEDEDAQLKKKKK